MRALGKLAEEMPLAERQRLRFWEFTTKRSKDGVSVGMTFTIDGAPETATNHIWFGVALVNETPDLRTVQILFDLLMRRFDAFISGKPNPFPEPEPA